MKRLNKLVLGILAVLALSLMACQRNENKKDGIIPNVVTDIDGNSYDAVRLGQQVWMKTNLRTKHFRDGSAIPDGSYYNPTTAETPGYDSKIYGLCYNWSVVDDKRGLCPKGWHVPSNAEWNKLERYVGSRYSHDNYSTAKALASTIGWSVSNDSGTPGCQPEENNASGFGAVPGGSGICAYFWSSTKYLSDSRAAYYYYMYYSNTYMYDAICFKDGDFSFSVRCVRD